LIDEERYMQVVQKRERIRSTLAQLDSVVFTSSRLVQMHAQEVGIPVLAQMMSARELLRRPDVRYHQVAQLAQCLAADGSERSEANSFSSKEQVAAILPLLAEEIADEVELQVKYENYVRKQEQMVHRVRRLEEMRIPESLNYNDVAHLRTEARQKLTRTQPRTVGQASRVEGVTPADVAILMVYLEKIRVTRSHS
jgi:tRNA uridine 5-carboxymethylaminomethyl modification enzyme